jgi:hypothetical protein
MAKELAVELERAKEPPCIQKLTEDGKQKLNRLARAWVERANGIEASKTT